jgi:hypothetical protein
LRPAGHAFSAGCFFLRLPLRSTDKMPWRSRLLRRNRAGVFSVRDTDHGDGGPLLAWADALLRQGGITDASGEVWLHTFPRMLGYLFNPVSFWFCHRLDGRLRAVICEVNNTFGERHCYLLAHPDGRPLTFGEELTAAKTFHVSPFCAVAGRYRFRFMLTARGRFIARIDHDDDDGPLLQTSIEGSLRPLRDRDLATVLLRYPAFTLTVVLRIHWHALRLWLKRVPFFSKPPAPDLQVTRSA